MIIISGCSDNHFKTMLEFIKSMLKTTNLTKNSFVFYDLGLNDKNIEILNNIYFNNSNYINYNLYYKKFDYSKYPEWYNIEINAGEYAWKPAIIYETYKLFSEEVIIWMDAGNLIYNNLDILEDVIRINNVYSPISSGLIKDWTYKKVIELLRPENLYLQNRNGACIGLNCSCDWVKNLIEDLYYFSSNKDYIAPEGSSRINHRQDQALFTILYYKYQKIYNFNIVNKYINFTIHNDID